MKNVIYLEGIHAFAAISDKKVEIWSLIDYTLLETITVDDVSNITYFLQEPSSEKEFLIERELYIWFGTEKGVLIFKKYQNKTVLEPSEYEYYIKECTIETEKETKIILDQSCPKIIDMKIVKKSKEYLPRVLILLEENKNEKKESILLLFDLELYLSKFDFETSATYYYIHSLLQKDSIQNIWLDQSSISIMNDKLKKNRLDVSFDLRILINNRFGLLKVTSDSTRFIQEIADQGASIFEKQKMESLYKNGVSLGFISDQIKNVKELEFQIFDLCWNNSLLSTLSDYIIGKSDQDNVIIYKIQNPSSILAWIREKNQEQIQKYEKLLSRKKEQMKKEQRDQVQDEFMEIITSLEHIKTLFELISSRLEKDDRKKIMNEIELIIIDIEYLKICEWLFANGYFGSLNKNKPLNQIIKKWEKKKSPERFMISKISKSINFTYPPTSIENMSELFKSRNENDSLIYKHLIMFYFIIDLENSEESVNESNLSDYSKRFRISTGWQQAVFGFWLLDHEENGELTDDNIVYFGSPEIPNHPWMKDVIKKLAYYSPKIAKRLISFHPCDPKDKLEIYLSNDLISEAFILTRTFENTERKEFFETLIDKCQEKKKVGSLIILPLDNFEDEILTKKLEGDDLFKHYVLRSKYLEASNLNNISGKLQSSLSKLVPNIDRSDLHPILKSMKRPQIKLPDQKVTITQEIQINKKKKIINIKGATSVKKIDPKLLDEDYEEFNEDEESEEEEKITEDDESSVIDESEEDFDVPKQGIEDISD